MKSSRSFGRDQGGQALAEFALVLPVLLILVIGIIEFGRAWNARQVITDAAREGARLAVVADPTVDQATVDTRIRAALGRAGLDAQTATITLDAARWRLTGDVMTVSVMVPYRFTFLGPLMGLLAGNDRVTLTGTAVMRNE